MGTAPAQTALTRVGEEAGVRVRFFHGRGGTISRGGGSDPPFLDALPAGSVGGDLRLTEQGETIAQKYANPATANFNLELLLAGTAGTSLRPAACAIPPLAARLEGSVNLLVAASREVYEGLLREGGFMEFYSQATPIDALEQSSIGSRPSRRTGQRTLADLRAIPWVFSWNQARFYLPGWFGVGSALARLWAENPAGFADLKEGVNGSWPFLRYVLMNVETNLASADRDIMSDYAGLVSNETVRRAFLAGFRRSSTGPTTSSRNALVAPRWTADHAPPRRSASGRMPSASCTVSRSNYWPAGVVCKKRAMKAPRRRCCPNSCFPSMLLPAACERLASNASTGNGLSLG